MILYGNADMNSAWQKLLADCPVQVGRGKIRVGDRLDQSDDLAVLMVYPAGSDSAVVGVVGGTGPTGMRLTNRLRYFISGIPYPDLLLLDAAGGKSTGQSSIRAWAYSGPTGRRLLPRSPGETGRNGYRFSQFDTPLVALSLACRCCTR